MGEALYQAIRPLDKANLIWNTLFDLFIAIILVAALAFHIDSFFKLLKKVKPGTVAL